MQLLHLKLNKLGDAPQYPELMKLRAYLLDDSELWATCLDKGTQDGKPSIYLSAKPSPESGIIYHFQLTGNNLQTIAGMMRGWFGESNATVQYQDWRKECDEIAPLVGCVQASDMADESVWEDYFRQGLTPGQAFRDITDTE